MQGRLTRAEFDALKCIWSDAHVIPDGAIWTAFEGGKSNSTWRIDIPGQASLVCKLFTPNTATPLFANDGTREAIALRALEHQEIAPELIAFQDTTLGDSLVYKHIEGTPWRGNVTEVATLLAHLHQQSAPNELPELAITPASLVAEGFAMLADGFSNMPPAPIVPEVSEARQVFLHGDIVPGNVLKTANDLRLIDWQCPAIGDPCADIAVFLSPAMQVIYGHRVLSDDEITTFLSVYERESGDGQCVARYLALAPLFHWRMAAYCHWKIARGDQEYARAAALELAQLQQG